MMFSYLKNKIKHKIIIERIGWISAKVWRGEVRWAKVNEIKVPLSRQVAALLQSACNIFISVPLSFIFYFHLFLFLSRQVAVFLQSTRNIFISSFPPRSYSEWNGNSDVSSYKWCIIYKRRFRVYSPIIYSNLGLAWRPGK